MQRQLRISSIRSAPVVAAVLSAALTLMLSSSALAKPAAPAAKIFPTDSIPFGQTYAQWSAHWWQWALAFPPVSPDHPFIDPFDCNSLSNGQSGPVWFLGATFGPSVRSCTIPANTALFVGSLNAEGSSLEGSVTEADQRDQANFLANHIVVDSLFLSIDGKQLQGLGRFRFVSSQFTFTAPTPWIFGDTGGTGTAVSDGYFVMFQPLSSGAHTLRFGGAFHFSVVEGDPFDFDAAIDTTYNLTVQ